MEMKVDRDWLILKAAQEGDLEIGAGVSIPAVRRAPYMKAVLFGMAAAPAAACIQVLLLMGVVSLIGSGGYRVGFVIPGLVMMLVPAMIVAYIIGALPTLVSSAIMYPIMRENYSALTEYLAGGAVGGAVLAIHAALFLRPELIPVWLGGIIPGMAWVYAYRRVLPREAT